MSIGPDFHNKQKTTTKKFATKVANKEKHIINLSDTQKNTKKEFSNTISQKKFHKSDKKKPKKKFKNKYEKGVLKHRSTSDNIIINGNS